MTEMRNTKRSILSALALVSGLALFDIAYSQDPVGTDVFGVMTSGNDPSSSNTDIFNDNSETPNQNGGFIPPWTPSVFGGPGTTGSPQGGPGLHIPGILIHPAVPNNVNQQPCGGQAYQVTGRMYFEMQVQGMQCGPDGVSPGVHRMCSDIAQQWAANRRCPDPRSIPKIPANIQRLIITCRTGVDPVTKQTDQRCMQLVQQENCKDMFRLKNEIDQVPALLTGLSSPQGRQVGSPNWPRSIYAVQLPLRLKACSATENPPAQTPCQDAAPKDMQRNLTLLAQQMTAIRSSAENAAFGSLEGFYRGMAEVIGADATFLAQRPGVPAHQISDAVANYLLNDYNQNDAQLRKDALEAVRSFVKDPAHFLGQNFLYFLPAANLCATKATSRLMLYTRLSKAASRLKSLNVAEESIATGTNSAPWCMLGNQKVYNPGGAYQLNQFGEEEACVPVSIAGAKRSITGKPYTGEDIRPMTPDRATKPAEMVGMLKENLGHYDIPDLGPDRMALQREGLPVQVSPGQLQSELSQSGRGGLVLTYTDSTPSSHMFRAESVNGTLHYIDDLKGFNHITGISAASNLSGVNRVYLFRYK